MAFYTKLCKNIKVFLVYVKKAEYPARKSGRSLEGGPKARDLPKGRGGMPIRA